MGIKHFIKKIPLIGDLLVQWRRNRQNAEFNSVNYWKNRYKQGGNSGAGSYNRLAEFKGEFLNAFVKEHHIDSVMELGCGDGNQLKYFSFPYYIGYDISPDAIGLCRKIHGSDKSKQFFQLIDGVSHTADLVLSLDVIYHLLEDDVFEEYMRRLFASANRYVIIYSSNMEHEQTAKHVKHRLFTKWVEKNIEGFRLSEHLPNKYPYNGDELVSSFADFFVFSRL